MIRDVKLQKRLVIGALGLLVLADVALATYSYHLSSAPRTPSRNWRSRISNWKCCGRTSSGEKRSGN